jgi:hypothetical protein
MILFGRMAADETWSAGGASVLGIAISLLRDALTSESRGRDQVKIDPNHLPEGQLSAEYSLTIEPTDGATRAKEVAWADSTTSPLDGDWLCIRLLDASAKPLAGLMLRAGRTYRIGDICRAFEASFDTGRQRRGRYAVLDSFREVIDTISVARGRPHAASIATFRCENPSCSRYRQQLLLAMPAARQRELENTMANHPAYPCPFCHEALEHRWALTFESILNGDEARRSQLDPNAVFIQLHGDSSYRRLPGPAGPMRRVAQGLEPKWGSCWNQSTIGRASEKLLTALESGQLPDILSAVTESIGSAQLTAAALDREHLQSLAEDTRELMASEKTGALADALAVLFTPRRMTNYRNDDDSPAGHPYIALPPARFLRWLKFLDMLENEGSFLDVGSGIGEKPFLAYALGRFSRCDGLELNAESVAVAKFLIANISTRSPYPINHLAEDALKFDGYGDYDLIYMYRPLRDPLLMVNLFRHIASQMKPGSVVFDAFEERAAIRRSTDGFHGILPGSKSIAKWTEPMSLDEALDNCRLLP